MDQSSLSDSNWSEQTGINLIKLESPIKIQNKYKSKKIAIQQKRLRKGNFKKLKIVKAIKLEGQKQLKKLRQRDDNFNLFEQQCNTKREQKLEFQKQQQYSLRMEESSQQIDYEEQQTQEQEQSLKEELSEVAAKQNIEITKQQKTKKEVRELLGVWAGKTERLSQKELKMRLELIQERMREYQRERLRIKSILREEVNGQDIFLRQCPCCSKIITKLCFHCEHTHCNPVNCPRKKKQLLNSRMLMRMRQNKNPPIPEASPTQQLSDNSIQSEFEDKPSSNTRSRHRNSVLGVSSDAGSSDSSISLFQSMTMSFLKEKQHKQNDEYDAFGVDLTSDIDSFFFDN